MFYLFGASESLRVQSSITERYKLGKWILDQMLVLLASGRPQRRHAWLGQRFTSFKARLLLREYLLTLYRSSCGQVECVSIEAHFALKMHSLNHVLAMLVNVVAAGEMSAHITQCAHAEVVQDVAEHVWVATCLVVRHLTDLEFTHAEADQSHAQRAEQRERAIHVLRTLHVVVLLNRDWSEPIQVELAELLSYEQLALDALTPVLNDLLLHILISTAN